MGLYNPCVFFIIQFMKISIWANEFELREVVKMRQSLEITDIQQEWKGELQTAIKMITVMLISINWDTESSKFYDFILDEITPEEFKILSKAVEKIVYWFVKKKVTSSSNTKHSSESDTELSVGNGE